MDKTEEKILKEPVQNGGSKRASVYPFAPVSEDESGMEDASVRMTSGLTEDEAVSGAEIPLQESRNSENVLRLENA